MPVKLQSDHKSCGFETLPDLSIRPLIDIETASLLFISYTFVRLQNLPWSKTGLVSRQVLHPLSKLQNWIWSKTGWYKTCLVSNTKDWLCVYKCIYIFSWYMSFRYIYTYIYKENICNIYIYIYLYIYIYIYIYIYTQSILVFDTMQVLYWPVLGLIQFCSFDRGCKTCLDTKLVLIPLQNWLCACSKTSFVPSLNLLHQNRLCACS